MNYNLLRLKISFVIISFTMISTLGNSIAYAITGNEVVEEIHRQELQFNNQADNKGYTAQLLFSPHVIKAIGKYGFLNQHQTNHVYSVSTLNPARRKEVETFMAGIDLPPDILPKYSMVEPPEGHKDRKTLNAYMGSYGMIVAVLNENVFDRMTISTGGVRERQRTLSIISSFWNH